MKLYLVTIEHGDEDGTETVGIFSTEEKAEDVAMHLVGQGEYIGVEEVEVDTLLAYTNFGYMCYETPCCDRVFYLPNKGKYFCKTACGYKGCCCDTPEEAIKALETVLCHRCVKTDAKMKIVKYFTHRTIY